jgi:hypothetical protein
MNEKRSTAPRILSRHSEREARRLGWYHGASVTWREFLEQYPYGAVEIAAARRRLESAA